MMRGLTSFVLKRPVGTRLAFAGAVLAASGLTLAGAQTTPPPPPTTPPSIPAQSPPSTTQVVPQAYQTQTVPVATPSTATTQTPQTAGPSSQAAPLIGANPATPTATTLLQYQNAGIRPAPFGSQLFTGGNVTAAPTNVVDPTYILKPGDQVNITLWGSVPDSNSTAVIDTNGNVFVPGVGPVKLGGLPASRVDAVVKAAAAVVYRNQVHIYAAPVTTVPITVFVTGPAVAPGPYAGLGSDSVIAFLQRAGGIDPNLGSYRNITVLRGGQTIAHMDLYEFLRTGHMMPLSLHNNDTIVVGQQGPVVAVSGVARAPFTFELAGPSGRGEEILYYARPRPEVNYVALLGFRNAQPLNDYVSVHDFARLPLMDGDRVGFSADAIADSVVVQVTGAYQGPAAYVVPKNTTLGAMLARIPMDALADRRWIHLQRVSAAFSQKQLLSESLARLQKAVYTQPAPTAALVTSNAAQATAIQQYITYASQIQPIGDVAFPPGVDLNQVSLEPDDVIVIPYRSQVVSIGGEVTEAQALLYQPGLTARAYVQKAGGFN
ncbi:MAG: polysaccharide biosynthesis/export family protein, partial [Pseudomonadota bacterium]|nr:polysaccharide biosynthesis/export family protein [Pseudomonadota bacterium]